LAEIDFGGDDYDHALKTSCWSS